MSDVQNTSERDEIALPARRDRPITLMHRLELALVIALTGFFKLVGVDAASAIAGTTMRHIGPLLRPLSRRAEDNLARVFPDWPREKIRAVTKDAWENIARTGAEFVHLETLADFETNGRIEMIDRERFDALVARPEPVILFSAHFANWEVGPSVLARAGYDLGIVYRAANNPLTDEWIIKQRAKVMSRRLVP